MVYANKVLTLPAKADIISNPLFSNQFLTPKNLVQLGHPKRLMVVKW
jgi:hypothetical protein